MNNDFLMNPYGDLYLDEKGIRKTESIRQAILIRLRWFLGEWLYGPQHGVDYFGQVFVKNPNKTLILRMIADQIRAVDGVKTVNNLKLTMNRVAREGEITFTFTVDNMDLYWEEMDLWRDLVDGEKIVYEEDEQGNLRARKRNGSRFAVVINDVNSDGNESPRVTMTVTFTLVDGDLIATYEEAT